MKLGLMFWVLKLKIAAECSQNTCSLLRVSVQGHLSIVRSQLEGLFLMESELSAGHKGIVEHEILSLG